MRNHPQNYWQYFFFFYLDAQYIKILRCFVVLVLIVKMNRTNDAFLIQIALLCIWYFYIVKGDVIPLPHEKDTDVIISKSDI